MINVHRNITNIKHFFIVSTRLGLRLEFYWTQKKDKVQKSILYRKDFIIDIAESEFAVGKKPVLSRLCKRVEGPSASVFKQRGPHAPGPLFEGPATTLYTLFLRQMKNYATLNFANILLQCNSKFGIWFRHVVTVELNFQCYVVSVMAFCRYVSFELAKEWILNWINKNIYICFTFTLKLKENEKSHPIVKGKLVFCTGKTWKGWIDGAYWIDEQKAYKKNYARKPTVKLISTLLNFKQLFQTANKVTLQRFVRKKNN